MFTLDSCAITGNIIRTCFPDHLSIIQLHAVGTGCQESQQIFVLLGIFQGNNQKPQGLNSVE